MLVQQASLYVLQALGTLPLYRASADINREIDDLIKSRSSLLQYPTNLTQGIVPKAIHSHNDYWREVPLLTALSLGVASVEADVWLVNKTLLVGHEAAALTKTRTFDSLYVQPLLDIIKKQNPPTLVSQNSTTPNGVFDTSSATPLQLLVDIKTDGVETLPFILDALAPLRSAKFLTTFANGTLTPSAVTVVGTGNSPLAQVMQLEPRDYFFDAPLMDLDNPGTNVTWDVYLSPLASTDYEVAVGWSGINNISDAQRQNVTKFVNSAHAKGIRARFWDTPGWPINARDNVWRELLQQGADWLNADDLVAASEF